MAQATANPGGTADWGAEEVAFAADERQGHCCYDE
jgi:hypothetical protein